MEAGQGGYRQIQVEAFGDYGNGEVFRHKLGLIPEETEGLTEAFKSKLGVSKRVEIVDEGDDEDAEYSNEVVELGWLKENLFPFDAFKQNNFKKDVDATKPLTSPLLISLPSQEPSLALNCVVISHAIKTFCRDIPPLKNQNKKASNILSLVYKNLANKDSQENRKSVLSVLKGKDTNLLSTIPSEDFSLMQFILSYGVLNHKLRNEIYSQLCLQVLVRGPSEEGKDRAWLLHLLCAGSFLPNKTMIKHYISFLNDWKEKEAYAKQSLKLLQRTHVCGPRYHPPNSLEFKAAKALKKIMLPVMLADGRSVTVQSDSATTASEICAQICNCISLKDQFGFAIYISIDDKVSSLGNGSDHVMDAIGECEQASADARWALFFAKEIFTPWHDAEFDAASTNLIYCQIIKSVLNREVKFKSDEDLARFIARRCYVEMEASVDEASIAKKLDDLLPKKKEKVDEGRWSRLVLEAFKKMDFLTNNFSRDHVKWSIVEGAQMKWPLQFAALFEVHKTSARPALSNNDVVLAISCRGVFLLEEPFKLLCGLHYYEIIEVNCLKGLKGKASQVSIMTTNASMWQLECTNAQIVCKILASFIDGLRRRSRWAVALHHFILRDHTKNDKDDFRLKQGDIVELLDESSQGLPDDWMYGRCERSNLTNRFPYDCVYIFPTTKKPPEEFLSIFAAMSQKDVHTLPRKRAAIVLKKDTITPSALKHTFI